MGDCMKYERERELYNRAFGRFISEHRFDPDVWLDNGDRKEYRKLIKEVIQ